MEERLLTAREAANLLGVYFRTLRRWAREGRVASVRLSENQVRFRPSDLAALIEVRKRPAQVAGERKLAKALAAVEERLRGGARERATEPPHPTRKGRK